MNAAPLSFSPADAKVTTPMVPERRYLWALLAMLMSATIFEGYDITIFHLCTPDIARTFGLNDRSIGAIATAVRFGGILSIFVVTLADRYGRRTVILATLVLSIPAIFLYTAFPGPWAFASAILIGVLAASTAPLMLLMAQQLMASRAGLASGLVMGLGFVTGAIGIPINGAIADAVGLQNSLMTHVILVAVTIVVAWFLPNEKEIERYSDVVPAITPAIAE